MSVVGAESIFTKQWFWGVGAVVLTAGLVGFATLGHDDEPPSWEPRDHDLIATGDVLVGRDIEREILLGTDLFAEVRPVLQRADEVIINLEGPLTSAEVPLQKDFVFRGRPEDVSVLRDGGVTVAALANNHISDYGSAGLLETLEVLDAAEIGRVGAGRDLADATEPLYLQVQDKTVAVVNFSQYNGKTTPAATETQPGQAYYGSEAFASRMAEARERADVVIAVLHHGAEYVDFPTEDQASKSRQAIDFGADAVISHHPHVTQGIEEYRGKPIFHSLGNFIFDQETSPWDRSFFVAMDFIGDDIDFTLYPYFIRKGVPAFMSDEDAAAFFERVNEISPAPLVTVRDGLGYLPASALGG